MVIPSKIHKKYVGEIFGFPPTNKSEIAQSYRNNLICPFRNDNGECDTDNKISNVTDENGNKLVENQTGACMAWNNPRWSDDPYPVIICPYRFYQNNKIFEFIKNKFFDNDNAILIEEFGVGSGGMVDGMALELDQDGSIKDILHIEYQSDATTGTRGLVQSVRDFMDGKDIWNNNYGYGLNSKASIKGSSLQMIDKGFLFESLKIPSVWIMQDYLFNFMRETLFKIPIKDVTSSAIPDDQYLFFMTTKLVYDESNDVFNLEVDKLFSSSPKEMQEALSTKEHNITSVSLLKKLKERIDDGKYRQI